MNSFWEIIEPIRLDSSICKYFSFSNNIARIVSETLQRVKPTAELFYQRPASQLFAVIYYKDYDSTFKAQSTHFESLRLEVGYYGLQDETIKLSFEIKIKGEIIVSSSTDLNDEGYEEEWWTIKLI